jgi:hypothetical protein
MHGDDLGDEPARVSATIFEFELAGKDRPRPIHTLLLY